MRLVIALVVFWGFIYLNQAYLVMVENICYIVTCLGQTAKRHKNLIKFQAEIVTLTFLKTFCPV